MSKSLAILGRLRLTSIVIAVVCGGIIHIAATLAIPRLAPAGPFQRLADKLPLNRMHVLPRAAPGAEVLPFTIPDTRLAICRFDLSAGPVAVTVTLPERGWSLSLYSEQGDNFYTLPAAEFRRALFGLTLMPQQQTTLSLLGLGRQATRNASSISVPGMTGYVVVRAMVHGRAYEREVETLLNTASCKGPSS